MTDYFNNPMLEEDILKISSLGLAHVGDAVYELMVRSWLCHSGKATSKDLHRSTVAYVAAPAQAAAMKKLIPYLSENELDAFKRGRNAKVSSVPHSATYEEYHVATGLETLFGYLYLKGHLDRINELFDIITEGELCR